MDPMALVSPGAILTGASVAAYALFLNRRHERRKLLTDRLDRELDKEMLSALRALSLEDPNSLAHDPARQERALRLLLPLQRVAANTSAHPVDWTCCLANDTHDLIRECLGATSGLLQVVRCTTLEMPVHVWNGHRSQAFSHLLKAFRFNLETPK